MQAKKVSDSINHMNELVLPNDTNTFGNLMGGRLMYWMDIAAAYCAAKHCRWVASRDVCSISGGDCRLPAGKWQ